MYNEPMKKRTKLLAVLCALVVVVAGLAFYKQQTKCERGITDECLPKGMCMAPNDAVVSCDVLK